MSSAHIARANIRNKSIKSPQSSLFSLPSLCQCRCSPASATLRRGLCHIHHRRTSTMAWEHALQLLLGAVSQIALLMLPTSWSEINLFTFAAVDGNLVLKKTVSSTQEFRRSQFIISSFLESFLSVELRTEENVNL